PVMVVLSAIFVLVVPSAATAAGQDDSCPASTARRQGIAAHATMGVSAWTGKVGSNSKPGVGMNLGVGYDVFEWLGVELAWTGGTNDSDAPYPPAPATFSANQIELILKPRYIMGQFDCVLLAGAGLRWVHPNVLVRIEDFADGMKPVWTAGVEVRWNTPVPGLWAAFRITASGEYSDSSTLWLVPSLGMGYTVALP
ncbi:MAG: hypothetical protein D6806_10300, partial [Deltaproteobacteria bacterium]